MNAHSDNEPNEDELNRQLGRAAARLKTPFTTWCAREDRERLINQALGYQADVLPRARGAAQQILREAEGYKEKRVLLAQGETARFLSVLAEYEKAKEVTRERLHLETAERVLPEIDKLIVDGDISQRLMPLLPLGGVVTPPV